MRWEKRVQAHHEGLSDGIAQQNPTHRQWISTKDIILPVAKALSWSRP
jgi:hypothetical protein